MRAMHHPKRMTLQLFSCTSSPTYTEATKVGRLAYLYNFIFYRNKPNLRFIVCEEPIIFFRLAFPFSLSMEFEQFLASCHSLFHSLSYFFLSTICVFLHKVHSYLSDCSLLLFLSSSLFLKVFFCTFEIK